MSFIILAVQGTGPEGIEGCLLEKRFQYILRPDKRRLVVLS